jgi:hypothetical protein
MKGVFKKGNDIDFFTVGLELAPNWKLVALNENEDEAQFQNTKFSDLKFSIKVQASTSSSGRGGTARAAENQF